MTSSRDRGRLPRLHLITNDDLLRSETFSRRSAELIRVGGERIALHLRGRGLGGGELWERAVRARTQSADAGAWLFINDRLDVAMAADADGVQLGWDSFAIADARRLLPAEMLIGASVHDATGAEEAVAAGADLLLAGTLYESKSHPGRPGSGLAWLGAIQGVGALVIGIGGITVERVEEVRSAGAYGVAVVSGIWAAADPVHELERYLKEVEE